MRVLVLGSGGREHALAWKLAGSPLLGKLLCAPGNPGTAAVATNLPVAAEDPGAVTEVARRERVDLVVVGPELPLTRGVGDALRRAGIPVFGPDAAAARLESSKAFAKEVMEAAGVPTASHRTFDDPHAAERYAREMGKVAVKADGLAAGKGVVVAGSPDEAVRAVRELSRLGTAGARLVLEEVLEGEEVSVIALADGERFVVLPPAQDHKRLLDGDRGPNTGGMGAVTPAGLLDAHALAEVGETIIRPVLREMARRGHPFSGALYAGLMLTAGGPRVLEFNARFGDPEAQVLVLQLAEDLLPLLHAAAAGRLAPRPLALEAGASVGVVLASAGYPGTPRTGLPITGAERLSGAVQVFHAGTARVDGQLVTSGGRVLTVCARAASLPEARAVAYGAVSRIHFEGMQLRRDIGERAAQAAARAG
ncbi:MAG TPA: phosphoribosylamine--glycine ligase [Myxococcaceae bacterium]|jgi:phosphoribosylamine--glycine ligase|nr:phosphoribosylamine--glycine ligase [Myxococcaceae bacterium]